MECVPPAAQRPWPWTWILPFSRQNRERLNVCHFKPLSCVPFQQTSLTTCLKCTQAQRCVYLAGSISPEADS